MNVKEAVAAAKAYISDLFASEGISNLGLEEVEYDNAKKVWLVTLGFSRPWEATEAGQVAVRLWGSNKERAFKVVCISDTTGQVISVKNREPALS